MARKKRYRGHYCHVCGLILPNEKFSGKGHAAHICRKCARKPLEQRAEETALHRISRVYGYMNLSRDNRRMLEDYSRSPRERVRVAAVEAIASFTRCFPYGDFECDDFDYDDAGCDDAECWDVDDAEIPF
ncbi:MAG TPA: hypothetical protein VMW83_13705 [Spirochaetia bacterium]|nr:hypothetical protein [Spirochaetia bacterium]